MKFIETSLSDSWLIIPELHADSRGFFARSCCGHEFADHGLWHEWVQFNISYNECKGTLRGLHFSLLTVHEVKLVRCTAGAIFDVIVDIRPESPSFGRWFGTQLTAENRNALYIPMGFAHGFQTLTDRSEVFYQMGDYYTPAVSKGIRYNDPDIGVKWPISHKILSQKDEELPLLEQIVKSYL